MSTETIKQSLDAYCSGISSLNPDQILTAFAEDAADTDPAGSPPLNGHAAIRGFFEGLLSMVAAVQFQADEVFGVGNHLAVQWSMSGRGKNGRDFTAAGVDAMVFNDAGKIQALTGYWDAASFLATVQGQG